MKSSTVFKKAALSIFNKDSELACVAIGHAKFGYFWHDQPEVLAFQNLFAPPEAYLGDGWFGPVYDPDNQLARQLALLFMAEMSKDLEK